MPRATYHMSYSQGQEYFNISTFHISTFRSNKLEEAVDWMVCAWWRGGEGGGGLDGVWMVEGGGLPVRRVMEWMTSLFLLGHCLRQKI